MESNSKAYHDLFRLYKSTYSEKTAAKAQADFNLLWKEKIKPSEKGKINFDAYNEVSTELKEKKNKKDVGIRSFFSKKTPKKSSHTCTGIGRGKRDAGSRIKFHSHRGSESKCG